VPDFFHVVHEIVKGYSLALGQRWRHAQQELTKATEALARRQGLRQVEHVIQEARGRVEGQQAEVTRWEEASHVYRGYLESLSLTLHPFHISDSTPQTSAQVETQLTATVEAIAIQTLVAAGSPAALRQLVAATQQFGPGVGNQVGKVAALPVVLQQRGSQ
jgi:hypothetical protein